MSKYGAREGARNEGSDGHLAGGKVPGTKEVTGTWWREGNGFGEPIRPLRYCGNGLAVNGLGRCAIAGTD